ncbi:MAG: hypothetical protein ABIU77_11450 [Ferruginibacter sp.]
MKTFLSVLLLAALYFFAGCKKASPPEKTLPVVTTDTVTVIKDDGAVIRAGIISDGNSAILAKGICYSTFHNPDLNDSIATVGNVTQTFELAIAGLTEYNTYYARAYATNSVGTAYGNEVIFVTACPYNHSMAGTYVVVRDDWQDWSPGEKVNITNGPDANQINLNQVWPNSLYGYPTNPLLVNINPANGIASVPLVTFAHYPIGAFATAQGAGNDYNAGYVSSCSGRIYLNMIITFDGKNIGENKLILQKQ